MKNLTGEVAIVTGGGRGIGKAIALGLAKAGCSVAVVARSQDQLAEAVREITELGSRAISFAADVSDPAAVQKMVSEVEKSFGSLSLLVNNAGLAGPI
jgi:glucose 1-dehydrogenase